MTEFKKEKDKKYLPYNKEELAHRVRKMALKVWEEEQLTVVPTIVEPTSVCSGWNYNTIL